jgi:hypothetical protein
MSTIIDMLKPLNERQLWALRTCLQVLDVLDPNERIAVPVTILAAHIEGLARAAAPAEPLR